MIKVPEGTTEFPRTLLRIRLPKSETLPATASIPPTSIRPQPPRFTHQIGNFRKKKLLLRRRKRHRRIQRSQPDNLPIQIFKSPFMNNGRDLSRQPSRSRMFIQNDDLVGLL